MAGIYLHIPFCKMRCIYCDFYSTTFLDQKELYISALCKELEQRRDYLEGESVKTIYLGGGTPSLLSGSDFKRIFTTINSVYGMSDCQEITLEANPDDLTSDYISQLRSLPFNRISIGIQSFNDTTLKLLNRRHTAAQAIEAITLCREAGFKNISIDLMYGLPGQTVDHWKKDLQQAINLHPEHISAYHLIYEEGTRLWELRKKLLVEEIDEDLSINLFALMIDELQKEGYLHYEISNFCKPGKHSLHNSAYWQGNTYLGCGAGAHSYNGISRQWNKPSLTDYIRGIETSSQIFEKEDLDLYTRYNDFIIISLRTCWGASLEKLESDYGKELKDYCLKNARPHLESGKLAIMNNTLYINKNGIFISDTIMSDLLWIN